jgi:hypothetical protein
MYHAGVEKVRLRARIGCKTRHTVYKRVCMGTMLAVKLAMEAWGIQVITICTDNQAAIKVLMTIQPQPEHHILNALHKKIEKL